MKKIFKLVLGFGVGGTCLFFSLRGFDSASLKHAVASAKYVWIVPFLIVFSFNQWLRTLRWNVLLSPMKNIPARSLFPVLLFGFFMNTVLPARSGEFIRAYTAQRKFGIHGVSVFGSIIAERMSDLLGLLVLVVFAAPILPMASASFMKLGVFFAFGLVGIGVALVLLNKNGILASENRLVSFVFDLISRAIAGFVALRSFRKIGLVVFFSLFIWVNEVVMIVLMSKAMLLNLSFLHATAVLVGLSVGVMIPGAPGYIGTYEFFGKQMLEFLGHASDASLSFVLVLHFFQILSLSLMGIVSFFYLKKAGLGDTQP